MLSPNNGCIFHTKRCEVKIKHYQKRWMFRDFFKKNLRFINVAMRFWNSTSKYLQKVSHLL